MARTRWPRRRDGWSGLVPLPGWDAANDWQGFVGHEDLPRALDPEAGFFVTANHDLNRHGRVRPINVPMAPYRAQRIEHLQPGVLHQQRPWDAVFFDRRAAAGLLRRIDNGSTNAPTDFLRDLRTLARGEERRLALAQCRTLEREIAILKSAIQRSGQFAEQVELNARVKELEARVRETREKL